VKFETYSSSILADMITNDSVNEKCTFPQKLELYIFYYPILIDTRIHYKISGGYYIAKKSDTPLSNTSKNFIEVAIKYVDLTNEYPIE
jgi:hypothetical protein